MRESVLEGGLVTEHQSRVDGRKRLQAAFDNALDAILTVGRHMRFVDAHPAACALTGDTYEELFN